MSYNQLNFNEDSPDLMDSLLFMENIIKFFQASKYISHLNFSGMNFNKDQLRRLIKAMKKECLYLICLHLSDNEISQEREFYYEILDEFGITEQDVLEINRSKINQLKVHPNQTKKYDVVDIDYNGYLNEYFDFEVHKANHCCLGTLKRLYKDRLILAKEYKIME